MAQRKSDKPPEPKRERRQSQDVQQLRFEGTPEGRLPEEGEKRRPKPQGARTPARRPRKERLPKKRSESRTSQRCHAAGGLLETARTAIGAGSLTTKRRAVGRTRSAPSALLTMRVSRAVSSLTSRRWRNGSVHSSDVSTRRENHDAAMRMTTVTAAEMTARLPNRPPLHTTGGETGESEEE